MFFLLTSPYFDGKASNSRDAINIDKPVLENIKKMFSKALSKIFEKEVPEIKQRNETVSILY